MNIIAPKSFLSMETSKDQLDESQEEKKKDLIKSFTNRSLDPEPQALKEIGHENFLNMEKTNLRKERDRHFLNMEKTKLRKKRDIQIRIITYKSDMISYYISKRKALDGHYIDSSDSDTIDSSDSDTDLQNSSIQLENQVEKLKKQINKNNQLIKIKDHNIYKYIQENEKKSTNIINDQQHLKMKDMRCKLKEIAKRKKEYIRYIIRIMISEIDCGNEIISPLPKQKEKQIKVSLKRKEKQIRVSLKRKGKRKTFIKGILPIEILDQYKGKNLNQYNKISILIKLGNETLRLYNVNVITVRSIIPVLYRIKSIIMCLESILKTLNKSDPNIEKLLYNLQAKKDEILLQKGKCISKQVARSQRLEGDLIEDGEKLLKFLTELLLDKDKSKKKKSLSINILINLGNNILKKVNKIDVEYMHNLQKELEARYMHVKYMYSELKDLDRLMLRLIQALEQVKELNLNEEEINKFLNKFNEEEINELLNKLKEKKEAILLHKKNYLIEQLDDKTISLRNRVYIIKELENMTK